MERVPADGPPPRLLRRARQGTGIPGCDTGPALSGAAGSTPHLLLQALKNVLMPSVSLNWHRQSFGCGLPQFICGANNTL